MKSLGSLAALITCRACKFHKYISVYLVVEINKRISLMLTCTKVFYWCSMECDDIALFFVNEDRDHFFF